MCMDNVALNKAETIERCIRRIQDEYAKDPQLFRTNITKQDSIILNLQRACEAAVDLGMHWVRVRKLGVPQDSRDAFRLLEQAKTIDSDLSSNLQDMVGFRNIAVHDYKKLSLDIVEAIIQKDLHFLSEFAKLAIQTI